MRHYCLMTAILSAPLDSRSGRDYESPPWCYALWGVPAALAVFATYGYQASLLSASFEGLLWTASVAWAGIGCFVNGRSCGRVHCIVDGIAFPLLSVFGLLNILSVISFSWSLFWIAFLAILGLSFTPEFVWRRYAAKPGASE